VNRYQRAYVEIKSIKIPAALREVLKDVSGIGLGEGKSGYMTSLCSLYEGLGCV